MKRILKWTGIALGLLLAAGVIAPYLSGNRFAPRIRAALENALGRKVEIGAVHFNLFTGPGFAVDNVVIHENPAIGIEPVAYVGTLSAMPRFTSLFGGRLEFASIRLDDGIINLAKTGGPADPGRWNFEALLNHSVIRAIPELHLRGGRINFKFGDTKSVYYLTSTDLDISPPTRGSAAWRIDLTGQPARTDKPARGFANFIARGRWQPSGAGRLDLDVRLERANMSELTELIQGHDAGIHGLVDARMQFTGPLDNIRIAGNIDARDVHRWDQMPPYGSQHWSLRLSGRLDAPAQVIELESTTAGGETLPLAVRFRCSNYLAQPRWGVALNWNRFPAGPVLELARHLGANLPPSLQVTGSLDGVLGYSVDRRLEGVLDFHDASVSIPNSPPIGAQNARLIFDGAHATLAPVMVRTAQDEQAQLQGDYDWAAQSLNLTISTTAMRLESLRAQAALAAIPWVDQISSGLWQGQLHYQLSAGPTTRNGWTGAIEVQDVKLPLPGLAEPLIMQSASVNIEGTRVQIDGFRAQSGKIAFEGDYRYEPQMTRPHRLRIVMPDADAAELERLLMPTLRHQRGLIASALNLGRPTLPDWLAARHADAQLQFGVLRMAGVEARDIQAHLQWDGGKAEFSGIRGRLDGGHLIGTLAVNLRGSRPSYHLESHVAGIEWKSGKVDADSVLESSGTGAELLARLHSTGAFAAHGVDLEALPDLESVTGAYDLAWRGAAPILRFIDLHVVSGDDTYNGQGSTQPDGRLMILLTSGTKEMHVSGTLAELRVDQPESR